MVLQCNITSCPQKIQKIRIEEHLLECKVPQVSPPSNMSPFTPWTQWVEIQGLRSLGIQGPRHKCLVPSGLTYTCGAFQKKECSLASVPFFETHHIPYYFFLWYLVGCIHWIPTRYHRKKNALKSLINYKYHWCYLSCYK